MSQALSNLYTIVILVCIVLMIAICIYGLIKKKHSQSEYKEYLEKKREEKETTGASTI